MKRPQDLVADGSLRVGIIGMGYVGIPLALRFSETGFRVIGFDVDEARVGLLNAGKSAIQHIPDTRIAQMREAGFVAVSGPERIGDDSGADRRRAKRSVRTRGRRDYAQRRRLDNVTADLPFRFEGPYSGLLAASIQGASAGCCRAAGYGRFRR